MLICITKASILYFTLKTVVPRICDFETQIIKTQLGKHFFNSSHPNYKFRNSFIPKCIHEFYFVEFRPDYYGKLQWKLSLTFSDLAISASLLAAMLTTYNIIIRLFVFAYTFINSLKCSHFTFFNIYKCNGITSQLQCYVIMSESPLRTSKNGRLQWCKKYREYSAKYGMLQLTN